MGSSTGSMFYAFGAFLILYLVGASIYQIFLWIRKWREKGEWRMVDAIIIVLVIILLFFALKGSLKHFKGESPCCGGGSGNSGKAKTKFLDGPVIGKKTLTIEGMHCEHCVNAVTNALNEIDGVVAKVTLKSNSAEVSYDREINEADLKNAVKKAGYEVTGIS